MNLYKSDKYSLHIGTKSGVGFVTCWNDPEVFLKKFPDISAHYSLMGSLYSREGVSIILRNLALNPTIRKLVVYGGNPLSNTEFGKAGREMLLRLWENGVNSDSVINNSSLSIHKEINPEIVAKIISNVGLIDKSDLTIDEIYNFLKSIPSKDESYMQSMEFPEVQRNADQTFPSEKVGFSFRGNKIYDAWLKVVESILRYGDIKKTVGRSDVKELQVVTWTFDNEDLENKFYPQIDKGVLEIIGLEENSLNTYEDIFVNPENKKGSGYTYGERLRNYKQEFDQITNIISLIKEDKFSRRAVATTLIPEIDGKSPNPPCLTHIQVIVDSASKVNLYATFRSHDIFKAAIPNAFGLLKLQDYICKELGMEKGSITIISNSAHMYEEDLDNARKLVDCQLWGDIKTRFDEKTDTDPRGVVRIMVKNSEIIAEILDLNGNELISLNGKTAKEVGYKIARLNLLGRSDHYVDIMIELIKAEVASKTNKLYIQDKPI